MTSLQELSPAHPSTPPEFGAEDDGYGPTFSSWRTTDVPKPSRPSPIPLVFLALLAGVAAMVLGGVAVVVATRSAEVPTPPPAPPPEAVATLTPKVERQALALLAKPSTDRIVFRGSQDRLVLVVGSGGRAAILVRGFERADTARPYYAWIVGASGKPVRAARFRGSERAVFLSKPVGHKNSVVVAPDRAAALRPKHAHIVAVRG